MKTETGAVKEYNAKGKKKTKKAKVVKVSYPFILKVTFPLLELQDTERFKISIKIRT